MIDINAPSENVDCFGSDSGSTHNTRSRPIPTFLRILFQSRGVTSSAIFLDEIDKRYNFLRNVDQSLWMQYETGTQTPPKSLLYVIANTMRKERLFTSQEDSDFFERFIFTDPSHPNAIEDKSAPSLQDCLKKFRERLSLSPQEALAHLHLGSNLPANVRGHLSWLMKHGSLGGGTSRTKMNAIYGSILEYADSITALNKEEIAAWKPLMFQKYPLHKFSQAEREDSERIAFVEYYNQLATLLKTHNLNPTKIAKIECGEHTLWNSMKTGKMTFYERLSRSMQSALPKNALELANEILGLMKGCADNYHKRYTPNGISVSS